MANLSLPNSGSPFDSIRHIDENENEFWIARELMSVLGYAQWRQFDSCIDIAVENLEINGDKPSKHFLRLTAKSRGRTGKDYHLSRYACYHVALACDGRKPEVAAAKKYFVVKTREAETIIPAQSEEINRLAMENHNLELKLKVYEAQQKTLAAAGMLALTAPALAEAIICPGITIIEKVEVVEKTVVQDYHGRIVSELDGVGITTLTKEFGFKNTNQTWAWLESIGYGKNSGHWKQELTAHPTSKISSDVVKELRKLAAQRKGDRQQLIGEQLIGDW